MHNAVHNPTGMAAAALEHLWRRGARLYVSEYSRAEAEALGPHNWMTVIAGSMVGELMQSLGYRKVGRKPMPQGSVAKTAATWG